MSQSEHSPEETEKLLKTAHSDLNKLENWSISEVEATLRQTISKFDWTPKQAFMTVRMATTGTHISPPLFDTLAALGKDVTLSRLLLH